MNCAETRPYLALPESEQPTLALAEHLAGCPTCAAEREALLDTWAALGQLHAPAPSPTLRVRIVRRPVWHVSWRLPAVAALLLMLVGFGAGWLLRPMPVLDDQTAQRQGVLRLLRRASPGDRATGLALVAGTEDAPELLDALLERVLRDPDPRIRREAAEALALFAGRPQLRDRIVAQLARERDPEVQLALVDLLGAFREQAARAALRRLLDEGRLQGAARDRARQALVL